MSMTYSDILILLKAGYTKDDIDNMQAPTESQALLLSPETPAPSAVAAASEPSESLPQESVPAPAVGDPEPAAPADMSQQILAQLTELVKTMQASNRGAAEIPGNIIDPGTAALDTLRSLGGIAPPDNK